MPNYPLDGSVALDGTNTADFFYLACGEEDDLDAVRGRQRKVSIAKANAIRAGSSANKTEVAIVDEAESKSVAEAEAGRKAASRMIELEARCRVYCKIMFGGFHPPPANRRIFGDLAYLEVTLPGASKDVVHITAVPSGFYVNKTSIAPEGYGEPFVFDPRPAENACYSHAHSPVWIRRSYAATFLGRGFAQASRRKLGTRIHDRNSFRANSSTF